MGGLIALTVREEESKETRVVVATYDPERFINNIGFVNKDPLHVQRYLGPESPLQPEKGHLAPVDYGLIVVDYVSDQILDSDYGGGCSVGYFHEAFLSNASDSELEGKLGEQEYEKNRLLAFLNAGRISYADYVHFDPTRESGPIKERSREERINLKGIDLQEEYDSQTSDFMKVLALLKKLSSLSKDPWNVPRYSLRHIGIDLSPFKIIYCTGYEMRQRIKKLGFKLSPEEEKTWDEWLKEREKTK